ncbi:hypothetical protein CGZ80_21165 [Rhodopirellula sp. MGV]|nr:hypothetical protein CGZ80_21165 [Rhodopirellula sp. MGV]
MTFGQKIWIIAGTHDRVILEDPTDDGRAVIASERWELSAIVTCGQKTVEIVSGLMAIPLRESPTGSLLLPDETAAGTWLRW